MKLESQIAAALVLDIIAGDPRWMPHPVKLIARGAMALENPMRRNIPDARLAGVVTASIVVGSTALAAWTLVRTARRLHPMAGDAASILLLYTTFAGRDLADHAMRVDRALAMDDLTLARDRTGWMVGRDTHSLNTAGIVRAVVESVAENTVDGVTAPLFFAALGGPVAALTYKAVSTLDSTFGYKNERYIQFGWASARLDDVAAFIPARLTFPLIALAALLTGLKPLSALRYGWRDCRKHASPNSAWSEAAAAGALGVQLGGPLYRRGKLLEAPLLGESTRPLEPADIRRATSLMAVTAALAAACFVGLRMLLRPSNRKP